MPGIRKDKRFLGAMTTAVRDQLPVEARSPNESWIFNTTTMFQEYWNGSNWMPILANGYSWNDTRQRYELLIPCHGGEEIKYDAIPARVMREHFISGPILVPTILGLSMELMWTVNGRRGGAVDVNETNYISANEIGGGLDMLVLAAGGQDGDYTALHWGDNYPFTQDEHPQIGISTNFVDSAGVAYIGGIVDDTKSTGTDAFAVPDNGIYVYMDTSVYGDDHIHLINRVGGADTYDLDLGSPPVDTSCGFFILDVGEACLILNGVEICIPVPPPIVKMQPYAAVIARGIPGDNKEMLLRDFSLIMDAGY